MLNSNPEVPAPTHFPSPVIQTPTAINNRFHWRSERKLIVLISSIHVFSVTSADHVEFYHLPTPVPMLLQQLNQTEGTHSTMKPQGCYSRPALSPCKWLWSCKALSAWLVVIFKGCPPKTLLLHHLWPSSERRLPVCAKSASSFKQTDQDLNWKNSPSEITGSHVAREGRFACTNTKKNSNIKMKESRKAIWSV